MKDGNITGEEQKIKREDKICNLPSPLFVASLLALWGV